MILAFYLDIIPFCKKINIIIIIGQDNVFAEAVQLFARISWEPVINNFFFRLHLVILVIDYLNIFVLAFCLFYFVSFVMNFVPFVVNFFLSTKENQEYHEGHKGRSRKK
jgi:hypothetical protein